MDPSFKNKSQISVISNLPIIKTNRSKVAGVSLKPLIDSKLSRIKNEIEINMIGK